ncbi:MAG: hypothetical protein H0U74_11705 [Bradymonadaceae bacterium]|nr:hypothetical protein [Lujinxingiaceae bacterium]
MADFLQIAAQNEQRLGQYATRLFRIEAHIRRGERRAARAQMRGFVDELIAHRKSMEFPMQSTLIGAQMGLLGGGGSLVRGRLPGALIGALAGWLYGNHMVSRQHFYIDELISRCRAIEDEFNEASAPPEI